MLVGAFVGAPLGAAGGFALLLADPKAVPRGYIIPRFMEIGIAGAFVAPVCAIVGAALGLLLGLVYSLFRGSRAPAGKG